MIARGCQTITAAIVAAVLAPAVVAFPVHAAPSADNQPRAALEKVSPADAVTVRDDHDCFTLEFKGHGFPPVVIEDGQDAVRVPVQLRVGTDRAMGALRGESTTVLPDEAGDFDPVTMNPCGITTHGSNEQDYVCKAEDLQKNSRWYDKCREIGKGGRVQGGGEWKSSKVIVIATQAITPGFLNQQKDKEYDKLWAELPHQNPSEEALKAWKKTKQDLNTKYESLKKKYEVEYSRKKDYPKAAVSWPLTVTSLN